MFIVPSFETGIKRELRRNGCVVWEFFFSFFFLEFSLIHDLLDIG